MRRFTSFAVFITLLCSCAGWQEVAWVTADRAQKTSEKLIQLAMPVLDSLCDAEVDACELALDAECKGYHACKAVRRYVFNGFVDLQFAATSVEAAVLIADREGAMDALADVVRLLGDMYKHLKERGAI